MLWTERMLTSYIFRITFFISFEEINFFKFYLLWFIKIFIVSLSIIISWKINRNDNILKLLLDNDINIKCYINKLMLLTLNITLIKEWNANESKRWFWKLSFYMHELYINSRLFIRDALLTLAILIHSVSYFSFALFIRQRSD